MGTRFSYPAGRRSARGRDLQQRFRGGRAIAVDGRRRGGDSVSVVVPSHNRAALLPRALDSVLAQSRPADQIVVVDDGSDDGSAALIGARYPQVTYLYQDNRGVSAARNAGIGVARGDWIALLDSDDVWQQNKLERQLADLRAGDVLAHCDEIWIRNGRRVNPMRKHRKLGGEIYQHCLPRCAISPSAALIRRDVFDRVGLFDETLPACEDYDFWLRVCARYPVRFLAEPLVIKYGGHDDQLSKRYWGMDRFRIQSLEKLLKSAPLTVADRRATLLMLQRKIDIYLTGARKRGGDHDRDRLEHYDALRADVTAELTVSAAPL